MNCRKHARHWLAGIACTLMPVNAHSAAPARGETPVPIAHAAWVYDISNRQDGKRRYDPGYYAMALNNYNRLASEKHKIRLVYTYAGSMEMYCRGRDPKKCRLDDLIAVYPLKTDQRLIGSDGTDTVLAYAREVDASLAGAKIMVVPLIDGVESADYEGSMKGFNELPREMAYAYADKVSRKLCSDENVAGVQFDIEPFNVSTKNGQYYFYERIAENFAGRVPPSLNEGPVECKNKRFPKGRFFSVFGSSNQLNPAGPASGNIAKILTMHHNGYYIAPLYDLGSGPAGQAHSVTEYQRIAARHAKQMAEWSSKLNVMYQLGIPAAATVHEYGFCRGVNCRRVPDDREQTQEAYTEAALAAVDASGARSSDLFRGLAIWAWTRGISVNDCEFEPQVPTWNAIEILKSRL